MWILFFVYLTLVGCNLLILQKNWLYYHVLPDWLLCRWPSTTVAYYAIGLDMLKLCKVRHDHKTLISVFQVPKVYFGKENWTLNYALIQFWDFCNISLFLKVLSLKPLDISRSNSYKFSYTTYQFRFYCGEWILH